MVLILFTDENLWSLGDSKKKGKTRDQLVIEDSQCPSV